MALPEMNPGCAGTDESTMTNNVCARLLPQALFAVTKMVPPLLPGVALIEVVVELPDQPEGSVQV